MRATGDVLNLRFYIQETTLTSSSWQVLASAGAWSVVYFMSAIFFCSFYLLNLVLAVVALSYEMEIKSVDKEVK